MFSCCSLVSVDGDSLAERIRPCSVHNRQMLFVCQNTTTCRDNALFCTHCAEDHKGHDFQTVYNFFTPELTRLVTEHTKGQAENIGLVFEQIKQATALFKATIEMRLLLIEESLDIYEAELKEKYPTLVPFRQGGEVVGMEALSGDDFIDNSKMAQILHIQQQEATNQWMEGLSESFEKVLVPTGKGIGAVLDELQALINNRNWECEEERGKSFKGFLEKYRPNEALDPYPFKFSEVEKNEFITVWDGGTTAEYTNDLYSNLVHPVALMGGPLSEDNNRVTFKVQKMDRTAFFFDSTTVFLGVCLPKTAKEHQFANLEKPSHGGYAICSKGQVYHSKLPDLESSHAPFSFGEGQQITVWVDFNKKTLNFTKKGKFKDSVYSMDLAMDKRFLSRLTPFVGFAGDQGAKVQVAPLQDSTSDNQIAHSQIKF